MSNNTLKHATTEVRDGVATLTITEAGPLNILSTPVIRDMCSALAELAQDDSVRVLVLRGTGDRSFIAGADIKEMAELDQQRAVTFISNLRDLCEATRHFPTPVIIRIPGWCLGGGLEFAMAGDIRIASDNAQVGMPEVQVGIPSVIHAALMPRLIGDSRASWLLLTGEMIIAQKAVDWGLLNEAVPLEQLDQRIDEIAQAFAKLGPAVLRQQKTLLRRWEHLSVDEAIEDSIAEFGQAFKTGEPGKFMNEFLEAKAKAKALQS